MKTTRSNVLLLTLFIVLAAGLAARIDCWFIRWPGNREETSNPLEVMIGEGENLLAPMSYREADVYFHSGFYPTIFDNGSAFRTEHIAVEAGAAVSHNTGDDVTFLGKPLDFFDAFSRHFYPTLHTHLSDGGAASAYGHAESEQNTNSLVGEILPWLWLSAKLNPHQPDVYDVTAYWLVYMHRCDAAVNYLREGLRHNPDDPSLLFELGNIYFVNYHDLTRARNIWEGMLRLWDKQTAGEPDKEKNSRDNRIFLDKVYTHLAALEEQAGNDRAAIRRWEQAKQVSFHPEADQAHIDRLRQKRAPSTAAGTATH